MTHPVIPADLAEIIEAHNALFGGFRMSLEAAPSSDPASQPSGEPAGDGSGEADEADEADKPKEPDWKARSREWERKAKSLKTAADELAALKAEQQTAEERAATRQQEAEQRAAEAEARALRREIALEYSLSSDDASLLDDITDEDAIRRMAKRLQGTPSKGEAKGSVRRQKPREGAPESQHAATRKLARSLFSGK